MSTDSQGVQCRRKIAENLNHLSRAHERYRRQTDDRRLTTDERAIAYSEREREFGFTKNASLRSTTNIIGRRCDVYFGAVVHRVVTSQKCLVTLRSLCCGQHGVLCEVKCMVKICRAIRIKLKKIETTAAKYNVRVCYAGWP